MKADTMTDLTERKRILAPRTSEEEALFIARKYLENKAILEAKLANAVNGGRFLRQNMLDVVAAELSTKFNVANRNRKYVEQKLRDMKKEARKYLNMAKATKVLDSGEIVRAIPRNPPEPIRVMMEAMADDHLSFSGADASWTELDFSDTTSKADGSEAEDDDGLLLPGGANASESVASTSSSGSFDLSATPVLGIDTILGAYFGQPMLAAMAGLSNTTMPGTQPKHMPFVSNPTQFTTQPPLSIPPAVKTPTEIVPESSNGMPKASTSSVQRRFLHRRLYQRNSRNSPRFTSRVAESKIAAADAFKRLCESMVDVLPMAAKSFEDACKLQGEYFRLQISLTTLASQMHAGHGFHLK